jgi:hypothetical protein
MLGRQAHLKLVSLFRNAYKDSSGLYFLNGTTNPDLNATLQLDFGMYKDMIFLKKSSKRNFG